MTSKEKRQGPTKAGTKVEMCVMFPPSGDWELAERTEDIKSTEKFTML